VRSFDNCRPTFPSSVLVKGRVSREWGHRQHAPGGGTHCVSGKSRLARDVGDGRPPYPAPLLYMDRLELPSPRVIWQLCWQKVLRSCWCSAAELCSSLHFRTRSPGSWRWMPCGTNRKMPRQPPARTTQHAPAAYLLPTGKTFATSSGALSRRCPRSRSRTRKDASFGACASMHFLNAEGVPATVNS